MTDELYHYGVLGMKWGVRRNPSKAYSKATAKASRLTGKYIKKVSKANEYNKSARSKGRTYLTEIGRGITENRMKKAVKLDRKAEKARKKAVKAFRNTDTSKVDKAVVDAGRKTITEFNRTVLNTNDPRITKGRELMKNVI